MNNIVDIKLDDKPLVIISDTHCNLVNIKVVKNLHPDSKIICLGDIVNLFAKTGEKFNDCSIQYFIDQEIPTLRGNHEDFLIGAERGNSFVLDRVIGTTYDYDLTIQHLNYLESLPIGFRLLLPDGSNYLCYHNAPKDLWGFRDKLTWDEFLKTYPIEDKTRGVIIGHHHLSNTRIFGSRKLFYIGRLSGKKPEYITLDKSGVKFEAL